MDLSVVVPVYNSAATLRDLIQRLHPVLAAVSGRYEVVLVNDGSADDSWKVIEELAGRHAFVRGVKLMRNYGQHNALLCGVREARYDVIITMDDDLQHPPEEIPKLLDKLGEGFDVVYGKPNKQHHDATHSLGSELLKIVLAMVSNVKEMRHVSAFRAFRSSLRDAFSDCVDPHIVLDVLLSWGTTRFAVVDVEHAARAHGRSNYSLRKLISTAMLVLTGFSAAPLRVATAAGCLFTLFGMVVFAYVVVVAFLWETPPGWPFLAACISMFSGIQLFCLGLLGEYIGRIFERSIQRPAYVIGSRTALAKSQERPAPAAAASLGRVG